MNRSPKQIDRELKSDPRHCAELIRELMEMLGNDGWSKDAMFGIHMAVEEAVMNAIMHGNDQDPGKTVEVAIRLEPTRFYAKISDQGDGFCMEDVPDPTAEENLEKTSGRGVMLMKTFVDECTYNQCGNSVELIKQRS